MDTTTDSRKPFYLVTIITRDYCTLTSVHETEERAKAFIEKARSKDINPERGYLWATSTLVSPLSYSDSGYRIENEWATSTQIS